MEKQNKKIICINAAENKGYEQVIFVMRDEKTLTCQNNTAPINFIHEAEKIINKKLETANLYGLQQNATIKKDGAITQLIIKKSSAFDIGLNICLMLACLFLTFMLISMG